MCEVDLVFAHLGMVLLAGSNWNGWAHAQGVPFLTGQAPEAAAAQQVGYNVIEDMGFEIFREFWPEISHKLKLPFREEAETENPARLFKPRGVCPHSKRTGSSRLSLSPHCA